MRNHHRLNANAALAPPGAERRKRVEQADGPRSYSYDAAGRVTAADNPAPLADEVFAYDELGNRTGGGEVVDGANRLQSRTGFSYTWDREGRQTARTNTATGEVTRFSWSDDGRLRSVTLPSGGVVRYAYDPMGRRITTTSTNGVRRVQTYGLDPNAVAEQSGGDPQTRYTFGLGYDTPLAMSTASSTAFFEQDALSSVTSLTNAAGAVTGRTSYDTYGQITSQTGQVSPYTYTGREHEPETGLYHYRARWYDPATGTFTSEDPVPAANLYGYALGNPVRMNDPTGLIGQEDQSAAMAIMQTLARSTFVRQGFINASISTAGQLGRCGNKNLGRTFLFSFLAGGFIGGVGSQVGTRFAKMAAIERGQLLLRFAIFQIQIAGFMQVAQTLLGDTDAEDPVGWTAYALIEAGAAAMGRAGDVADAVATGAGVLAPTLMNPDDQAEDCG